MNNAKGDDAAVQSGRREGGAEVSKRDSLETEIEKNYLINWALLI